jgi:hypothetical protein
VSVKKQLYDSIEGIEENTGQASISAVKAVAEAYFIE